MSSFGTVAIITGLVALPHLLPLHRVAPWNAALVWLLALAIRALAAVAAAMFILLYVPQTTVFADLTRWCVHAVLPPLTTHLGFSVHRMADTAAVLPGLALVCSVLWLGVGLVRGALALRRLLHRAKGQGPLGSTVLEENSLIVAATGIGRARVLVSDAALAAMDSEELTASLEHELGHLRRRHRPLLLVASLLKAVGRSLPGTARAHRELLFNLERDADEYAIDRTGDPLALASAICKVAAGRTPQHSLALGGRSHVGLRLEYLMDGGRHRSGPLLERCTRLLALTLVTAVAALAGTVSSWALAQPAHAHVGNALHCPD